MRLRVAFSKSGPLVYTSHLDLMRVWERSLRRAGIPLAYSGGFNPRPKLQLAGVLPLGHSGEAELLDVWLEEPLPVRDFARALVSVLPEGLEVGQVRQVDLKEPAMQTRILAVEYQVRVEWGEPAAEVETCIEQALAATELPHERRGRRYNLRPLIERLWLEGATEGKVVLGMQLAAREKATARPEAVLEALGMGESFARYHRRRLIWTFASN
jgi:radical SAM-linked protein